MATSPDLLPILVSVKRTAQILGDITTWQVYRLLEAGEIESRYIGRRRMVLLTSLREYAKNLPSRPESA